MTALLLTVLKLPESNRLVGAPTLAVPHCFQFGDVLGSKCPDALAWVIQPVQDLKALLLVGFRHPVLAGNHPRALESDRHLVKQLAAWRKCLDELFSNRVDEALPVIGAKDAGHEVQFCLTRGLNQIDQRSLERLRELRED